MATNSPDRSDDAVIVHLKDGRTIDLSGFTPMEAVAHLRALGLTYDDIEHTVHRVRATEQGR